MKILRRYLLGLLLLALGPVPMALGLEQILDPEDADKLGRNVFVTFFVVVVLIVLGSVLLFVTWIGFLIDSKWAKTQPPALKEFHQDLMMIVKIVLVPISVAVAFGTSQWLLVLTLGFPPWILSGLGAAVAIAGYFLAQPLISKVYGTIAQAMSRRGDSA